jgi:hypothetical protein
MTNQSLSAIALNGTWTATGTGEVSSSERMLDLICAELNEADVTTKSIRLADHDIKPGVTSMKVMVTRGRRYGSNAYGDAKCSSSSTSAESEALWACALRSIAEVAPRAGKTGIYRDKKKLGAC